MSGGLLAVRADAGRRMGAGHVMRCLALSQGWREAGGKAVFLSAALPAGLIERLRGESIEVIDVDGEPGSADDAASTRASAARCGAEWLVIDGYQFDDAFVGAARAEGAGVLVIDDVGFAHASAADCILNQNIYADESLYPGVTTSTRLLLGARYAMLRDEFVSRPLPLGGRGRRIVVSMGGGDPAGVTITAVRALAELDRDDVEALVLIGGSADDGGIEEAAGRCRIAVRVQRAVQDMAEVLAGSELAVCAAGSVAWELCFMGVPAILIATAANQEPIAAGVAAAGAGVDAGRAEALDVATLARTIDGLLDDEEQRGRMSARGKATIDGRGRARIVAELDALGAGRDLS